MSLKEENMNAALINNSKPDTGLGKYASELGRRLRIQGVTEVFLNYDNACVEIGDSASCARRLPLEHKYVWYARVQRKIPSYSLYHLSNQNISFLDLNPRIVTCYDIFHVTHPRNWVDHVFGKMVYSGLKKAVHIIAGSEYTKRQICTYYKVPHEKISVVYAGVDERFFRIEEENLENIREKYRLPEDFFLHVSNEQPRKNFDKVLMAFSRLVKDNTSVALVKVGEPQYASDASKNRTLLKTLGLEGHVFFLEKIPEDDLPFLYQLSRGLVFPSSEEGFGLPPLEAMASKTPVITSSRSSLPEVVGDSGILVNPDDIDGLACAMHEVLVDEGLREDLIRKGLKRARMFSWEKTARETLGIYEVVLKKL